jgi:hypothetical protein
MDKINLLPEESEHDVRVRIFIDPLSAGITFSGVLLLMVIYHKLLKTA